DRTWEAGAAERSVGEDPLTLHPPNGARFRATEFAQNFICSLTYQPVGLEPFRPLCPVDVIVAACLARPRRPPNRRRIGWRRPTATRVVVPLADTVMARASPPSVVGIRIGPVLALRRNPAVLWMCLTRRAVHQASVYRTIVF